MADMKTRKVPRWPLLLIGAPAAVAIWSGWVGLGTMCGFGLIHPLPGIWDHARLNTAITLPIGVEAYGAYALGAWLSPGVAAAARRFARGSAIGSLALGMTGQVIYHLLAAAHAHRAPWPVIVVVSCVPVVTLGFGAALTHLLRDASGAAEAGKVSLAAPILAALAARIAPRPTPPDAAPGATERATEDDTERAMITPPEAPGPATPSAPEPAPPNAAPDVKERATGAPLDAPRSAPPARQDERREPRLETRAGVPVQPVVVARRRSAKEPPWHATARRAVAKNPAITADELKAKCGVSLRSAQRYLQDHPPTLRAVDTSGGG